MAQGYFYYIKYKQFEKVYYKYVHISYISYIHKSFDFDLIIAFDVVEYNEATVF